MLITAVQQAPQAPPKRSFIFRAFRTTTSILFYSLCAGLGGALLAPYLAPQPTRDALWAFLTQKPLTAAETLERFDDELAAANDPETRAINAAIVQHPLAQALRAAPSADDTAATPRWREARPHMKIPAALRPTNLTAGTLAGPGRISVPPLIFSSVGADGKHDGRAMVALIHLGPQLCGHPGIVHGGLLATLLDEGLARCCFPALPNKMGVTANLTVDYRKPAMAGLVGDGRGVVERGGFFVLRAETTKVEGRKAWVKGWIEELLPAEVAEKGDVQPKKVVEAEALFIEPRGASKMRRIYADPE